MPAPQGVNLDPRPSVDAYLCEPPGGYMQVAEWLRRKYIERRKEEGPWARLPSRTRRNCIVALIKAQQFHIAGRLCSLYIEKARADRAGRSPNFWRLYCLLTACLILGNNPEHREKAESMYHAIEERPAHWEEMPVYQDLQELRWVYHRRRDHFVLHGHDDGLPYLYPVTEMADVPFGLSKSVGSRINPFSGQVTPRAPRIKWRGLINRRHRTPTQDHHSEEHVPLRQQQVSSDQQGLNKPCGCASMTTPCLHEDGSPTGDASPNGEQTLSKLWQYFSRSEAGEYAIMQPEVHDIVMDTDPDIGVEYDYEARPEIVSDQISLSWSALPRPGDELPALAL